MKSKFKKLMGVVAIIFGAIVGITLRNLPEKHNQPNNIFKEVFNTCTKSIEQDDPTVPKKEISNSCTKLADFTVTCLKSHDENYCTDRAGRMLYFFGPTAEIKNQENLVKKCVPDLQGKLPGISDAKAVELCSQVANYMHNCLERSVSDEDDNQCSIKSRAYYDSLVQNV